MAQNNQEEVDLFLVFDKIKKGYHNFLASIYKAIQFIIKHWIILLILIVGGYFAGYFWQKTIKETKETTLIVQNNFNSSSYVYQAIKLLNTKYQQGDVNFLNKNGFNYDDAEINEITIEPIVNIIDLLEMHETNDRNLDAFISNIEVEDEDLLVSEAFYPEYTYHRIIVTTQESNPETIHKILNYLNSNPLLNKIKTVVVDETKLHVEHNNTSIENIDAVFEAISEKNETVGNASQVFVKNQDNSDLHQLLERKKELIDENEVLKTELLKYDKVVSLINTPEFYAIGSFTNNKKILLPLTLVFIYIMIFVVRSFYTAGKKYANEES